MGGKTISRFHLLPEINKAYKYEYDAYSSEIGQKAYKQVTRIIAGKKDRKQEDQYDGEYRSDHSISKK